LTTIKQDNAVVCIHRGCEIIFEGPELTCPECGWQGVTFKEISEALEYSVLSSRKRIGDSYTPGEMVQVNNERYTGTGIYTSETASKPRMIGVRLEHGHIRWYEENTVSKVPTRMLTNTEIYEAAGFGPTGHISIDEKGKVTKS
jgi:uncharacterized protein (UPF0179 family)